jgi:hypothetical protein
LDWQVTLDNGVVEVEQSNVLMTDDGGLVYARTCGVSPSETEPARVVLDFEAPTGGSYNWLNEGTFVGTRSVNAEGKTIGLSVVRVGAAASPPSATAMTIPVSDAKPRQSWSCRPPVGKQADVIFTEAVAIEIPLAAYDGKRGSRTVVPIAGGMILSGKLEGDVLVGGADYQLTSKEAWTLDARYTLKTADGELILVRNCGLATGQLAPTFETRTDGPYDWLNKGTYLSGTPAVGTWMSKLAVTIDIFAAD